MTKTFSQRMDDGIAALDTVQSDFDYASTYTVSFVDHIGRAVEALKSHGFIQLRDHGALDPNYAELVFSTPDAGRINITFSFE